MRSSRDEKHADAHREACAHSPGGRAQCCRCLPPPPPPTTAAACAPVDPGLTEALVGKTSAPRFSSTFLRPSAVHDQLRSCRRGPSKRQPAGLEPARVRGKTPGKTLGVLGGERRRSRFPRKHGPFGCMGLKESTGVTAPVTGTFAAAGSTASPTKWLIAALSLAAFVCT